MGLYRMLLTFRSHQRLFVEYQDAISQNSLIDITSRYLCYKLHFFWNNFQKSLLQIMNIRTGERLDSL